MGGKSSGELHLTPPLYATARERRCGAMQSKLFTLSSAARCIRLACREWSSPQVAHGRQSDRGQSKGWVWVAILVPWRGGEAARLEGERSRAEQSGRVRGATNSW